MAKRCTLWITVVLLCVYPFAAIADPTDESWRPGLHELSAITLIAGAQDSLAQLELEQTQSQRDIFLNSALSSLSALYQLHGCEWAMAKLLDVYSAPDCPNIHYGYSADGRVRLAVEPMELRNPVFTEYTLMLVTIESNCGDLLTADRFGTLVVGLPDGDVVEPDMLSEEHELWKNIERLIHTFEPPPLLYPGGSSAFKQVYAVKELGSKRVLGVSLEWDGYTISVPYYENQVVDNS